MALAAPLTSVSSELPSAGATSPRRAQGMAAVLVQSPRTAWGCSMAHSTHSSCASLPADCSLHTAHEELAVQKTTPTLSPWWWGASLEPSAGLSYRPPPAEQLWQPALAGALCLDTSWPQWQPTCHRKICCLPEAAAPANWSPP